MIRLPPGRLLQSHAVFRRDPGGRCKRIGSLSLELAAVGEFEKIAEPFTFLFFEGFSYGPTPLVFYNESLDRIVSTFVWAMG